MVLLVVNRLLKFFILINFVEFEKARFKSFNISFYRLEVGGYIRGDGEGNGNI